MRIGIFGGTFDPPHVGHTILASEAAYQLKLDKLLWVLTSHPPHKQEILISDLEDRLEMVRAVVSGDPVFELSRVDIDRPGPHYAVDTLMILNEEYPGGELFYLMGSDSLRDLPDWERPQEFVRRCHGIGVMRRPQVQYDLNLLEQALPGVQEKVCSIDAPLIEIASRQIRQCAAYGKPFRYYVMPVVYALVVSRGLYSRTTVAPDY